MAVDYILGVEYGRFPISQVSARRRDTRLDTLELPIPKLRQGSYFASQLKLQRKVHQALVAGMVGTFEEGVSMRNVDAPVQSLEIA
jgi:transposase-like protein